MHTFTYIKSDLYRYSGRLNWVAFTKNYVFNRGFNFSVWLRLTAGGGLVGILAYPIYAWKKRRYGISISHKTRIGYGLYIGHGGPLIINTSAIIGHNVNLSPYTVIGANEGQAAHIGNGVYIGPNCCIVEQVRIGDDATIGAGSVVTKDIPAQATAAGNYARVLNLHQPGRYIGHRWPIEDQAS
ncbi:serine acetyltransferase [Snodgrassella sp. CFCC 13594]|uniref:serine acetyltransferase n=1 Tax=Snodgrassella sp. CFCC 13594 TaxID=1775559 RepID=UPI00082F3FEB|nr:serine acetyltransferase [Snodgrassella sp. CFCC 13594]